MWCPLFRCSHLILSTACNKSKRIDQIRSERSGMDRNQSIHFLCALVDTVADDTLMMSPCSCVCLLLNSVVSFVHWFGCACTLSDLLLDCSISNRTKRLREQKHLSKFQRLEHLREIDGFSIRIATKTSAEIGIHSELICIFKSISCNFRINSLKIRKQATANSFALFGIISHLRDRFHRVLISRFYWLSASAWRLQSLQFFLTADRFGFFGTTKKKRNAFKPKWISKQISFAMLEMEHFEAERNAHRLTH